ncbi:MAG: exopolyphosphatase [Thermoanaerobaculia bacterium]|nr:exopolyphosphatase [Thermoanaerobaculia bacterium]
MKETNQAHEETNRSESVEPPQTIAAVDLGSNSFRMVIARVVDDQLRLVDRLREGVRLAAFLDDDQRISPEGRRRALACLRKFGQRVRDLPPGSVRAVGTNTLRKARNRDAFLLEARHALGHPIEVVPGQEEARLIFLGAAHSLAVRSTARRLVVDIGGGSTECIIGEGQDAQRTESLYMGCVSYSLVHFQDGQISPHRMEQAETAARLELRAIKKPFRDLGWELAVGCSGTISAIGDILRENGWSDQGITPDGLAKLRHAVVSCEHVDDLKLPGLRNDRARVLPGGLAILLVVFEALQVQRMLVSSGAMREGVLYDLLGRLRHEDARDRSIERLVEQYRVDVDQAERVERTALHALEQVHGDWNLDLPVAHAYLSWAARLHEIGLGVAHTAFHKHGAYLVENTLMPGFSFQNQRLLALLVRGQRRKFPRSLFKDLAKPQRKRAIKLCRLLRLAIVVNRSRSNRQLPQLRMRAKKKRLWLDFPAGWLEEHPLTAADLDQESAYMSSVGFKLKIGSYRASASDERTAPEAA